MNVLCPACSIGVVGFAFAAARYLFRKEARAHRGRDPHLAHRAREDSLTSFSPAANDPLGHHLVRSPIPAGVRLI